MSNINHLDNAIDDNMEPLPNNDTQTNSESTTTDQTYSPSCMSISPQQPTYNFYSLSQMVVDERSNYSNEIPNQSINDMVVYQSRSRRLSITVNEFDDPIGEARPGTEDSVFNYVFAANRDEQSNDRIAQPSDAVEQILMNLLSPVVILLIFDLIWSNLPLGVQDTQPHTMVLPVLVDTSRRNTLINNENGDINEDATFFNDDDNDLINDENMNSNIIVRENIGTETIDELTDNVNSAMSNDVQDNNYIEINNQNERIMDDDITTEIEYQENLYSENDERGQVSPRLQHAGNNEIHDTVQSNIPMAPILSSSTPTTSTIESSEQVQEIEPLLAGPTDNNNHMTDDPAHLLAAGLDVSQLNARNRKQASLFNTSGLVDEKKSV